MVSAANSLRMTTVIQSGQRRLFWAYLLAIATAFVASFWLTLGQGYKLGATSMQSWFFGWVPTGAYKWAQSKITTPSPPPFCDLRPVKFVPNFTRRLFSCFNYARRKGGTKGTDALHIGANFAGTADYGSRSARMSSGALFEMTL